MAGPAFENGDSEKIVTDGVKNKLQHVKFYCLLILLFCTFL